MEEHSLWPQQHGRSNPSKHQLLPQTVGDTKEWTWKDTLELSVSDQYSGQGTIQVHLSH